MESIWITAEKSVPSFHDSVLGIMVYSYKCTVFDLVSPFIEDINEIMLSIL